MNIFRYDDHGRLAEEWVQTDNRSRLRQLGVRVAEQTFHEPPERTQRRRALWRRRLPTVLLEERLDALLIRRRICPSSDP
jgi:hypothetical protein